jgi:transposase
VLLPASVRVWVASAPVDLRRGHDGLCSLVRSEWKQDPYSGHLFVFFGKRKDRVKILFWSRGGFVLYYKRLERGVFRLPDASGTHLSLDSTALVMLLDGIDLRRVRRPPLWQPPVPGLAESVCAKA